MLTGGRLAGGVVFALLGWYIAGIAGPFFQEGRPPSYLIPLCTFLGLFMGWTVCGPRTGKGYVNAVSNGLTTIVAFSFCVVASLAFMTMMQNAMRHRYGGPMEAVVAWFDLILEQGLEFFDIPFIGTIIVGGIICAMIAEFIGNRFS